MAVVTTEHTKASSIRPPYVPFLTLKNFIARMKDQGALHDRIDKTVMSHLAGTAQSHLLLALKFLRLIKDDGTPTAVFSQLVEAYNTSDWPATIGAVIEEPFAPIVTGLNLTTSTPGQLTEAFRREAGTEGTVTEKSIRFYLKALDEANVPYSKAFNKPRGPKPGSRRKKVAPNEQGDNGGGGTHDGGEQSDDAQVPKGMISFPIHLPGKTTGKIVVPSDIDEDDAAMVEAAMAYLKLYAKKNAGKGKIAMK